MPAATCRCPLPPSLRRLVGARRLLFSCLGALRLLARPLHGRALLLALLEGPAQGRHEVLVAHRRRRRLGSAERLADVRGARLLARPLPPRPGEQPVRQRPVPPPP